MSTGGQDSTTKKINVHKCHPSHLKSASVETQPNQMKTTHQSCSQVHFSTLLHTALSSTHILYTSMENGQINKQTPKAHEKTRWTFAKSKSSTSRRDSRETHAAEEMEESGDGDGQVESEEATEVVGPQRQPKRKSGAADSAVKGRAG